MNCLFTHSVEIIQKETDGNVSLEGFCSLKLNPSFLQLHCHRTSFFFRNNEPKKEHGDLYRFLMGETVQTVFSILVTDEGLEILSEEAFERLLHSENFFARDFYGRKIQMRYVDGTLDLLIPEMEEMELCPRFRGNKNCEDEFVKNIYKFKVEVTLLEPFELSENFDQKYERNAEVFAEGDPIEKLLQVYRDHFDLDKKLIVKNGPRVYVASLEEELMYLQKEILESYDERLSLSDYLTLLESMGISGIDDSLKKLALQNPAETQVEFCWDSLLEKMNVGDYKFGHFASSMDRCTLDEAVLTIDNHISLLEKVVPLLERFEGDFEKSEEIDRSNFFARQVIEKIKLDPISYVDAPDFIRSSLVLNPGAKVVLSYVAASFANLAKKMMV